MTGTVHDEQFILFRVDGEIYAVNVHETQEVIQYKEPRRVPHSPAHVLGVINLRGAIIPVVGLRERFLLEPQSPDEDTRIIVTNHDGRLTGLVCDSVERVVTIAAANIEENPDLQQRRSRSAIRAIAHIDAENSVVFLLSLDAVLGDDSDSLR